MHRVILHLDMDSFYCAVEMQRNAALVGLPFAVGGKPSERGVVASCSYAARAAGVRSAMPMARAVQLCPTLIIVAPHFDAYRAASREVMERLHAVTPLVEQLSIDEAFLDVSDLPEEGEVIARRLQATIHDELHLPCSLGVASNKLLAKTANSIGKAQARRANGGSPSAITVVPAGQEAAFLVPLPVDELWGVGPRTAEKLAALGIRTIGDLAAWPLHDLIERFGKHGAEMAQHARGIDERPIVIEREAKSVSKETTFAQDIADRLVLQATIRDLAAQVGRTLRREGLMGATIKIKLRWASFETLTRQTTLAQPTNQDERISATALQLFEQTWTTQRVRLVGVGVSGFDTPQQLSFWDLMPDLDVRQEHMRRRNVE